MPKHRVARAYFLEAGRNLCIDIKSRLVVSCIANLLTGVTTPCPGLCKSTVFLSAGANPDNTSMYFEFFS